MLKLRCKAKAKKLELAHRTIIIRGAYLRNIGTGALKYKARIKIVASFSCALLILAYYRSHISKTPGFYADFAVIL